MKRIVTMPFAHAVQQRDVVGGGGQHGHEVFQAGQVQLADGAGMALLDQELAPALGTQAAHDLELGLAEAEALDVFLGHRFRVGQEDLGHALLDHGPADGVAQHVGRALGVENAQAGLLADGLLLLLGDFDILQSQRLHICHNLLHVVFVEQGNDPIRLGKDAIPFGFEILRYDG